MKVFVMTDNYKPARDDKASGWYFIADSAVTNTGKPFYVPDGVGKVEACLAPAVRISRLGKTVAPKFAHRYYGEMAASLHFRLPDLEASLIANGRPGDAAHSFDRALFVGEFFPFDSDSTFSLNLNGTPVASFRFSDLAKDLDEIIAEISVLNTLKMGDMILPALCRGVEIKPGDILEVKHNDEKVFHIKVK